MLRDGNPIPAADMAAAAAYEADAGSGAAAVGAGNASARIGAAMARVGALRDSDSSALAAADTALGRHICRMIDESLLALGQSERLSYSADLVGVLRGAWGIAALLRSSSVLPAHMIAALTAANAKWAEPLAKVVKAEPDWLLAGALVRPVVLNTAGGAQPADKIAPSESLLEWIAEAGRYAARVRADSPAIRADDLVTMIASKDAAQSVRTRVKRQMLYCARVGRAPAELVKARQGVESNSMTLGFFRAEAKERLGEVQGSLKSLGGEVKAAADNMKGVTAALMALPNAAALKSLLESVDKANDVRHAELQRGVAEVSSRLLGAIEERLASLALPQPVPQPLPAPTNGGIKPVAEAVAKLADSLSGDIQEVGSRQADRLVELQGEVAKLRGVMPPQPLPLGMVLLSSLGVLLLGAWIGYLIAAAGQ